MYMTFERFDAESFGNELLFGRLVVHEQHVGIAAPADVDRLPGADRDHAHVDARSPP